MRSAGVPISVLTITLTVYAVSVLADSLARPPSLDQLLAAKGYQQGQPVKSIHNYQVTDWAYLDDQHLVLSTTPARNYLITLASPCVGLAFAPAIGFSSTVGDLTPLDKLVLQGDAVKTPCPIRQINQLNRINKAKP